MDGYIRIQLSALIRCISINPCKSERSKVIGATKKILKLKRVAGEHVIIIHMTEQKTILLVEDEPLLSALLKQRFEKDGFAVLLAKNGEEALTILREHKPNLILLDIILPKVSGFEFMEKIREDPQFERVPIIITSNLGQESDIKKGKDLGAVGYFVKAHVSIEDLVTEVKNYFQKGAVVS